jgi:malonyl-CoA O-methyltransferase
MPKLPAGSIRDTAALAARYSETSEWQRERGLLLIGLADPSGPQRVLDLGCGTGELSLALARRVAPSGQVIAADPDPARLERAREGIPPELTNLRFIQASGGDLAPVADGSIDLIYSNYAMHWMVNLPPVFREIRRVLRPGGRLVGEFLGAPVKLFVDLLLMMPGGDGVMAENVFLDEPKWREVVEAGGLDIDDLAWPRFTLDYKDLPSLFAWLEATSHGFFDNGKIGPEDRAALERNYPGAIALECIGLRLILRKAG